jgi:hypothetical protein
MDLQVLDEPETASALAGSSVQREDSLTFSMCIARSKEKKAGI